MCKTQCQSVGKTSNHNAHVYAHALTACVFVHLYIDHRLVYRLEDKQVSVVNRKEVLSETAQVGGESLVKFGRC